MSRNVCCVPGCPAVAEDGGILHYFPHPEKDTERFQNWVKIVGGDIASLDSTTIHKSRRICRRHFHEEFLYPKNRLCKLAVPSLLLLSADVSVPSNWSSLPSNSPSSFTEDCDLNKDMSEEECTTTLFCICCLKSEIPYINLSTCSHGDFLNGFVMPKMQLKDQVVCYQCHSTMKKIKLFKLQIEKSFKIIADSVVKFAKSGQESSTLQRSQLFTIHISSKSYKRKLQTKKGEDPQSKLKKADIDNFILKEIPKTNITERPQTITKHTKISIEKSSLISPKSYKRKLQTKKGEDSQSKLKKADIHNFILKEIPKTNITERPQTITKHAKISIEKSSLPVIDKKSKNIEDALKIININQNSGCIKLASSLQTTSYSILGNNYNTNSDISNQLSIPEDILSSIINTANNAASISSENILTNTKKNSITDLEIENKVSYNMNTLTTPRTEVSSENISMNNMVVSNEIIIEDNIESENLELDEYVINEAFY